MLYARRKGWVMTGRQCPEWFWRLYHVCLDGRWEWYVHYNTEVWKRTRYAGEGDGLPVGHAGVHAHNTWSVTWKEICDGDKNLVFMGVNRLSWRVCQKRVKAKEACRSELWGSSFMIRERRTSWQRKMRKENRSKWWVEGHGDQSKGCLRGSSWWAASNGAGGDWKVSSLSGAGKPSVTLMEVFSHSFFNTFKWLLCTTF